jgi:hypothetical protein
MGFNGIDTAEPLVATGLLVPFIAEVSDRVESRPCARAIVPLARRPLFG